MMFCRAGRDFKAGDDTCVERGFRIGRAVVSALAIVVTGGAAVPARCQTAPSPDISVRFDIQPQPLTSALDRYGDVTGREVFYDAALAADRRSAGVRGVLAPDAALQMLLQGTGLSARFLADKSFVLFQLPPSAQATVPTATQAEHRRYYARIQDGLRAAVCRSGDIRSRHLRIVALFWIDPSGRVERYQRLSSGSAGDADNGIDATLRSVKLDAAPPAGFSQPVLIMIVPQGPGVTSACDASDIRLGPARAEP